MAPTARLLARLEFSSALEMLEFVHLVCEHVSRTVGLDDDALHWVSVAVRECVVNAIKHGNQNDASKHVIVEFAISTDAPGLSIRVVDQGSGFDPGTLADPLNPENVL